MIDSLFIYIFVLGILLFFVWVLYRRYRIFDGKVKQELSNYNFRFKSCEAPPLFSKSPFSNFEIYDYHASTSIMGISGEEVFRRIVVFNDDKGQEYKSWIEIQTRVFVVHKIKWELDLEKITKQ